MVSSALQSMSGVFSHNHLSFIVSYKMARAKCPKLWLQFYLFIFLSNLVDAPVNHLICITITTKHFDKHCNIYIYLQQYVFLLLDLKIFIYRIGCFNPCRVHITRMELTGTFTASSVSFEFLFFSKVRFQIGMFAATSLL